MKKLLSIISLLLICFALTAQNPIGLGLITGATTNETVVVKLLWGGSTNAAYYLVDVLDLNQTILAETNVNTNGLTLTYLKSDLTLFQTPKNFGVKGIYVTNAPGVSSATLVWDKVSDAAGYNLYANGVKNSTTNNTITLTGLAQGSNYSFSVSAFNSVLIESPQSPAISYKVPAGSSVTNVVKITPTITITQ